MGKNKVISIGENFLLFTIFFPYVPGILPTDTQPWFLGFWFFLFFLFAISKNNLGRIGISKTNRYTLYFLFFIFISLVFSISKNIFLGNLPTLTRIVSFLQFFVALLYGVGLDSMRIKENTFFRVIIVYLVFTGIFFLTNGAVENLLTFRKIDTSLLLSTGRGARTLSGEPSFFAYSIFNIYIIKHLLYPQTSFSSKKDLFFHTMVLVCLLLSFSGFGIVIFSLIFITRFPKIIFLGLLGLPFLIEVIQTKLDESTNRAFVLWRLLLKGNADMLFNRSSSLGYSFKVRLDAFLYNLNNFIENPILGAGFAETNVGGGLISYTGELGILFLFLLFLFFTKILLNQKGWRIKLLLIFWLTIRTISDSMGIPGIGVIIGKVISKKSKLS